MTWTPARAATARVLPSRLQARLCSNALSGDSGACNVAISTLDKHACGTYALRKIVANKRVHHNTKRGRTSRAAASCSCSALSSTGASARGSTRGCSRLPDGQKRASTAVQRARENPQAVYVLPGTPLYHSIVARLRHERCKPASRSLIYYQIDGGKDITRISGTRSSRVTTLPLTTFHARHAARTLFISLVSHLLY